MTKLGIFFVNKLTKLSLYKPNKNPTFEKKTKDMLNSTLHHRPKTKRAILLLALSVLFFWSVLQTPVLGQGWERVYAGGSTLSRLTAAPNGDFLCLTPLMQLRRVNPDGQVLWSKSLLPFPGQISGGLASVESLKPVPAGGYIAMLQRTDLGTYLNTELLMVKTDEQGNIEWQQWLDPIVEAGEIRAQFGELIPTSDGGYLVTGGMDRDPGIVTNMDAVAIKIDANGNELWRQYYAFEMGDMAVSQRIVALSDGHFVLAGRYAAPGSIMGQFMVIKIDANGDLIWQQLLGEARPPTELALTAMGCIELPDGTLRLAAYAPTASSPYRSVNMVQATATGQLISQQQIAPDGTLTFGELTTSADGGWALAMGFADGGQDNILVHAYGPDNQLKWQRQYGGLLSDEANDILSLPDNGFLIGGGKGVWEFENLGRDEYLLRLDSLGNTFTEYITGTVFRTESDNCDAILGEPLNDWLVTLEGNGGTNYALTDENGYFALPVEPGTYSVSVTTPNPYWQMCEPVTTVSVAAFDTVEMTLPAFAQIDCPWLEVDISTPLLRRCFDNTYTVSYCNRGTTFSEDAYVEVELDPYLEFNSSSLPVTSQTGNVYRFDLGVLEAGHCGSFDINVTVSCDSTLLGQTHCSTAHIYPDELCIPTPNWSGASIEVDASCTGDSIIFYIQNVGNSPTTSNLPFLVIEDQVILMQSAFNLLPQEIREVKLPANGGTFRLEADQEPNHPGNSMPSITVEGCGPDSEPTSLGYATQLPEDDADPFISIDCQENVGSWDPNDKRGFPKGYGEPHYIEPNTDLEYLIRFQNTGTDTAFTVIVRDKLSPFLDLGSLRPGTASHPYQLSVAPDGMLEFRFDHIELPDSNVNEVASHGFVKFRVSQILNNAPGTIINNTAAIYFDFNPPIITNKTTHRVEVNFIEIDLIPLPGWKPGSIAVTPNPLHDSALIGILDASAGARLQFEVYDSSGRLVRRDIHDSNPFIFQRHTLAQGLYFCRLLVDGKVAGQGKMVVME